jgi:hypothetical protein
VSAKLRLIAAFLLAVVAAALLASIFSTQFVIAGLQGVGVVIPADVRLNMTLGDFNILRSLLPVIAVCFAVGFSIAALCSRKIGGSRLAWFMIAGGSALVCTLLLISFAMDLMPVAGARTNFGLFTQFIAGAWGGFVFSKLSYSQTVGGLDE